MKLFYYQDDMKNFGDDLNAWLWPKILPELLDDDESHLLLGIGSILNHKLPKAKKYTVLGSGWGYGEAPKIDESWNVVCVRGKISCDAMGLDPELGIIDPAYLLQNLYTDEVPKKYPVSMIPHAQSLEIGHWQEICNALGIHLIDPRTSDIDDFVYQIRASEKVLTEAMHGAIMSDCFGVPWQGYTAYSYINSVKWNDWLSVLDHSVKLECIESLYKGYEDLSLKEKCKNEVKLLIQGLGFWQEKWFKPIPRKTNNNDFKIICSQLNKLINNGNFTITSRDIVTTQLDKLNAKLKSLKENS
jgi:succinoglycan biosynthesis protein ExoV|tara:strand:- start:329 stop:1231 length:903 start_codon:yes stop_codon:yes gene_type:complete